jgi:hypothetical protein
MLAQQQHGLIGRKIMAQPTETANGEIKIRLTGLGMRVIVDKWQSFFIRRTMTKL